MSHLASESPGLRRRSLNKVCSCCIYYLTAFHRNQTLFHPRREKRKHFPPSRHSARKNTSYATQAESLWRRNSTACVKQSSPLFLEGEGEFFYALQNRGIRYLSQKLLPTDKGMLYDVSFPQPKESHSLARLFILSLAHQVLQTKFLEIPKEWLAKKCIMHSRSFTGNQDERYRTIYGSRKESRRPERERYVGPNWWQLQCWDVCTYYAAGFPQHSRNTMTHVQKQEVLILNADLADLHVKRSVLHHVIRARICTCLRSLE